MEDVTKSDPSAADQWGDISIAQPKIWQYERVNTYLDGLLRDVEGVSLTDLTQLDPNAQNAGAIKFIQSALELGVQYNQQIGASNSIAMQSWQSQYQNQQQQLAQYNSNMQNLQSQQSSLVQQMVAQSTIITNLQNIQASGTALSASQSSALSGAQQSMSNLQTALTSVNSAITSAGAPPATPAAPALQAPTVQQPASGTSMSSTFYGLQDLLGKLPQGMQNELTSALQAPSYPATKRLDSFITLLYERLAREVSALQDDVMRDPNNEAFLLQFDVGLYPSSRAKNHMASVEFKLNKKNCPGCKIYSIYPGQSSYNVANYEGLSKRTSLWGALQFLSGFGISGAYSRQEDTLHGSLVQSVYTSGFQDTEHIGSAAQTGVGENGERIASAEEGPSYERFGWNYGAAPFEMYVTPGIRSTFAVLTVPRDLIANTQEKNISNQGPQSSCFYLGVEANWALHDNPHFNRAHYLDGKKYLSPDRHSTVRKTIAISLPGTAGTEKLPRAIRNEPQRLHVVSFEYNTVYSPPPPDSPSTLPPAAVPTPPASPPVAAPVNHENGCNSKQCAEVLIALDQPIDPNLVVTVNGTVLERVRDWRGRATSILPPAESLSDATTPGTGATSQPAPHTLARTGPGILEADQIGPDTWYALDSHRLLLIISNAIVPDEEFPTIRLADPSKKVASLPQDLDEGISELLVNGFHFSARGGQQFDQFLTNRMVGSFAPVRQIDSIWSTLQPAGPYSYDTFLPLFLEDPEPENFWASLGETGHQILVGFAPDPLDRAAKLGHHRHTWLAARDQVVIEDRDLDLAWSLSCGPQGEELVCDLPQKEIQAAYEIAAEKCGWKQGPSPTCPGVSNVGVDYPFASTLQVWVEQYDPEGDNSFYSPAPVSLGFFPIVNSETFLPWQATYVDATSVALEGCGYSKHLGDAKEVEILGLPIWSSDRSRTIDEEDDPPSAQFVDCKKIDIPTKLLARDTVIFRANDPHLNAMSPFVIWSSQLRPAFSRPTVIPIFDISGNGNRPTKWIITAPVTRVHCEDKLDENEAGTALYTSSHWLMGGFVWESCKAPPKYAIQHGSAINDWESASMEGRVSLQVTVVPGDLKSVPGTVHLIRGPENLPIANLPNPRELIFPSKLRVEQLNNTQFALVGKNAEAVAAVALYNADSAQTLPAANGAGYALVTLPQPPPAMKTGSAAPGSSQIASLSPVFGKAGDTVVIKGTNFGTTQGKSTVKFDGKTAIINDKGWSATSIKVTVPSGAATGKVIVTTSSGESNSSTFTVQGLAAGDLQIDSISPATGKAGTSIKIIGKNFGASQSASTLTFGDKPIVVGDKDWGDTSISTKIPAGVTSSGDVAVKVSGKSSNGVTFTIASAPASAADKDKATGAGTKSAAAALAPGTYAIVPLFYTGPKPTDYLPIEATDEQGKPLTLTISADKPSSDKPGPDKPSTGANDSGTGIITTIKISQSADPSQKPATTTPAVTTTTKPKNQ
jgi:hypothetical protein